MPYKLIDHTADTGLDLSGNSLEELFDDAFHGMMDVLGLTDVDAEQEDALQIDPCPVDLMLVDWLRELLDRYDRGTFVTASVEIQEIGEDAGLQSIIRGEPYDPSRHKPQTEIKGITYHDLSVRQCNDGSWTGRVIFDL
jgi:SHS2 domain-containing protein